MEEINGSFLPIQKPVDSLSQAYSKDIRPIIDVIDNLRRFGLQQDINLPNVVVVGDQSSGKSSIIEAISGIELPRGKGIVTRCPLELQLKRVNHSPWKATITFKAKDGKEEKEVINDPSLVGQCIREAQNKMCSTDKGVSRNLITLRVESPSETAPDLTLIDLPGIARIAIEGQPKDICSQIKDIIMDHVINENTVILCVVSANLDAAVNESINIAKEVDTNGIRTLGVITKPDTADEAHKDDVLALLNNEKIKLDKGFHMVKCRSQKELESNLTLEESLENETVYFETDKHYRTVGKSQVGTFNLARRITEELVSVIHSTLPRLRDRITTSLQDSQEKLATLPNGIPEDNLGKLSYLIGIISEMNAEIKMNLLKGKSIKNEDNLFYKWRTNFDNFKTNIDDIKNRAMEERFTKEIVKKEILRKRGSEISGFLNFELFETMITKHVGSYKIEADNLLKQMRSDTNTTIEQTIHHFFEHIPKIESDLKHLTHLQLEHFNEKTSDRIRVLFEEEKLIFTLDAAFEREMEYLKKKQEEEEANKNKMYNQSTVAGMELKRETMEENAKRMSDIIECYLKIVHTRLADMIPMSIRQCLHVELNNQLKGKFFNYATTCDIDVKVNENKIVNENRKKLQEKIERLQKARAELAKL